MNVFQFLLRRVPALLLMLSAGCAHVALPSAAARLGGRDVSLRYEGSCAHLACCSAYAVPVLAQTSGAFHCDALVNACRPNPGWLAPGFTCNPFAQGRYRQPGDAPYLACNDNDRWLSLPGLSHVECGETYMVCYRGRRVTAVARDKSASNDSGRVHYEASFGLLHALGANHEERETFVSIYARDDIARISADPACVGDPL